MTISKTSVTRVLLISLVVTLSPSLVGAQTLEDQVRQMAAEVRQLREELDLVKDELRRSKPAVYPVRVASTDVSGLLPGLVGTAPAPAPPATQAPQEQPTSAEALPLIRAQLLEQAQSKVESNSKFPMRLSGTVASNTYLNTGEPNWLDLGNVIMPKPAGLPAGSFNSSLRQSQVGVIVDGPMIGKMKSSALMAIDFFGGPPNFQNG